MSYPARVEGSVGAYERWDPERHGDAFAAQCADPDVMRFLGGAQSRAASDEMSARIADHWQTFGFGLWACLDGDECVGFAGVCRPAPHWDDEFPGDVEVGWRLARAAWGRGFATEGARLALAAAAEHLPLERVIAFVDPRNARSLAVVRRLGMPQLTSTFNRRLRAPVDVFLHPLRARAAA
jgi:RimJ/RimL family protein N-acetyltransferase